MSYQYKKKGQADDGDYSTQYVVKQDTAPKQTKTYTPQPGSFGYDLDEGDEQRYQGNSGGGDCGSRRGRGRGRGRGDRGGRGNRGGGRGGYQSDQSRGRGRGRGRGKEVDDEGYGYEAQDDSYYKKNESSYSAKQNTVLPEKPQEKQPYYTSEPRGYKSSYAQKALAEYQQLAQAERQEEQSHQDRQQYPKKTLYSQKQDSYSQKKDYYSQKKDHYSQKKDYHSQKKDNYSQKRDNNSQKQKQYAQPQMQPPSFSFGGGQTQKTGTYTEEHKAGGGDLFGYDLDERFGEGANVLGDATRSENSMEDYDTDATTQADDYSTYQEEQHYPTGTSLVLMVAEKPSIAKSVAEALSGGRYKLRKSSFMSRAGLINHS